MAFLGFKSSSRAVARYPRLQKPREDPSTIAPSPGLPILEQRDPGQPACP